MVFLRMQQDGVSQNMSFNLEQDTHLEQNCCQLTFHKPLLDRPSANSFCPTLKSHLPYLLDTLSISRVAHLITMLYREMGTEGHPTHSSTQNLRPETQLSSLTLFSQAGFGNSVLCLISEVHLPSRAWQCPNPQCLCLQSEVLLPSGAWLCSNHPVLLLQQWQLLRWESSPT